MEAAKSQMSIRDYMDAISSMPEEKSNFDTILDKKPLVVNPKEAKIISEDSISIKAMKELEGSNEEKV
jgi:hypothetical protein